MRARRCAVAAIVLSLAGSATALAAGSGPSGNPKGIALAKAKHRAYAKVGAETIAETGYVSMRAIQGKVSQFDWLWGTGRVPKGWSRASERAVVALRKGAIMWWRDDLTPPPCTSPGLCARIPVEVLITRSGAFYAYGNASSHTCFDRLSGTLPVAIGRPWDVVTGRYAAPVAKGATILLTHTYAWDKTQTATSTENVSAATDLDLGGTIKVSRGGRGLPAFTIRYTNTQLAKAPRAPRVNLCH